MRCEDSDQTLSKEIMLELVSSCHEKVDITLIL